MDNYRAPLDMWERLHALCAQAKLETWGSLPDIYFDRWRLDTPILIKDFMRWEGPPIENLSVEDARAIEPKARIILIDEHDLRETLHAHGIDRDSKPKSERFPAGARFAGMRCHQAPHPSRGHPAQRHLEQLALELGCLAAGHDYPKSLRPSPTYRQPIRSGWGRT